EHGSPKAGVGGSIPLWGAKNTAYAARIQQFKRWVSDLKVEKHHLSISLTTSVYLKASSLSSSSAVGCTAHFVQETRLA
ncbi:hypothetical protein, partial [uncultured Corynebacterium sp.]|uniref:hypothetical protein n=1 Tax=uncultured Corynebacterium sp. TaxID=159447 RepID=UPI00260F715B